MQWDARAKAVYYRTYSRPKDDAGTEFETWEETVDRAVVKHHTRLWSEAGGKPNTEEINRLAELVGERKTLVSGRTLWLGGTDYSAERACSQFNCAATRVDSVYSLVDACWLLLNGAGVGFIPKPGTLHGFLRPIPNIEFVESTRDMETKGRPNNIEIHPTADNGHAWYIGIGDSAEAWAKAIGKLFNPPTSVVNKLTIDFSEIRGPGKRLKGYGWICNGWQPLLKAIRKMVEILNNRAGDLLTEIDILDVVNHVGTILSSRRSAQIALLDYGHPRWKEFASAKKDFWEHGNHHRQQSNNSICLWEKPSKAAIRRLMEMIWDNGGSEPGFINGAAARNRAPYFDLTNPCFTGDTLIRTRQGDRRIDSLVGETAEVWDGNGWVSIDNFRVTGNNQPVVAVELYDGSVIRCTPYHTFILEDGTRLEAKDLQPGQTLKESGVPESHGSLREPSAYLKGFLIGDGTIANKTNTKVGGPLLWVYKPKFCCKERLLASATQTTEIAVRTNAVTDLSFVRDNANRDRLQGLSVRGEELRPWCDEYKTRLPASCFAWDKETKCEFLAGLFDADGSASDGKNGFMYQLTSVYPELLRDVQILLKSIGVASKLNKSRDAGETDFGPDRGGVCATQSSWRLVVSQAASVILAGCVRFSRLVSFAGKVCRHSTNGTTARRLRVVSVVPWGVAQAVYCCTVPTNNSLSLSCKALVGQCAEILLSGGGSVCNLFTTNLPRFQGKTAELREVLYLAARANYRQTCVNFNDGVLSPTWNQTNQALRLCGMSLTGIAMCPWVTDYDIRQMYKATVAGAYSMAIELGLPLPKLITTIKPEGSASKILQCTEGIHKPLGRYIFNSINFSIHDPLVGMLTDAGYRKIAHPNDTNACLICFPVDFSGCEFDKENGREVNRDSAVAQLNRYRRWNTLWTEHNSSNTISWDIAEIDEIVDWLDNYWHDFVGVSWLRRADPTLTAADLGYAYLPQEVVTRETYEKYKVTLREVDWSNIHGIHEATDQECAGGVCPVK